MECYKCDREYKKWPSLVKHIIEVHKHDRDLTNSEDSDEEIKPPPKKKRKKKSDFIVWSAEEDENDDEDKPGPSKKKDKKQKRKPLKKKKKIKKKKDIPEENEKESEEEEEEEEDSPEIRTLLRENPHWLRNSYIKGKGFVSFTRNITNLKRKTILPILQKAFIWDRANFVAKVGVLLKNTKENIPKEEKYKYFWPSLKNSLFEKPVQKFRNLTQFKRILNDYNEQDAMHRILEYAPASHYVYIKVLISPTPDYFPNRKQLVSYFGYQSKEYIKMSIFYCLAYAEVRKKYVKKRAMELYSKIFPFKSSKNFKSVNPFDKKHMNYICRVLRKAIIIYAPKKAANGRQKCIYRCVTAGVDIFRKEEFKEVYLYYYNKRFSFIKDINKFKGEFDCDLCKKYYYSINSLSKHRKIVHKDKEDKKKIKEKNGQYRAKIYMKQYLQGKGIPDYLLENIKLKDFLCYDIEACLLNKNIDVDYLENEDSRDSYLWQKHKTACVALMSTLSRVHILNVSDYSETASVDLVYRFVETALRLGREVTTKYLKENKPLLDYLNILQSKAHERDTNKRLIYINKIIKKIHTYATTIPIIGYNSARYDTQVLRYDGLFIVLNQLDPPVKIIKKGGFIKITTPHLIWLDALKYLGGGFSLRRFIKSFASEIKQRKSFFPYEAFDKLEKLDNSNFPTYNMFKSSLNGCNTLEEEYKPYLELLNSGLSTEEAIKELKLDKIPFNGNQNYIRLRKIWKKRGMKTWRDYINYYIYLDVFPFKVALKNMLEYFHRKDVDLFKSHCSLSSAAVNMLFQSVGPNGAPFFYLDPENYALVRNSTNGGLVTCNQRLFDCSSGETKIKDYKYGSLALSGKIINSYDFNCLYGGILGFIAHLLGPYVQRDLERDYSIKWCYENTPNSTRNPGCLTWLTSVALEYLSSHDRPLHIQSAYNSGERAILVKSGKRYKVDGYVAQQPHNNRPLVLEYLGCLYHAHLEGQCLRKGFKSTEFHPLRKKTKNEEIYRETLSRLEEIKISGHDIIVNWECEWLEKCKKFPKASELIHEHLIPGINKTLNIKTENEMIKAILDGNVYGIAFANVRVPEELKDTVFEYPPIFKKVNNFSLNDLPDDSYLKHYCIKHDIIPGKSFLTTFFSGDDLVLPTEYLRFLIQQGYIITNLRRVLQFGNTGEKPFKKFVDSMVSERRNGAAKGDAVSANMAKLILNAAVGFSLMKTNLLPTTFVCNRKKVKKMLRLKKSVTSYEYLGPTRIEKRYFEGVKIKDMYLIVVEKENTSLVSDMPVLLGWKVLAMAKLQMLLFMEMARKYFDDAKWMFLYLDTDSVICALAEPDIDACVIEPLKEEWRTVKRQFFVTNEPIVCDNYTPFKLKIEASADKFACISAKMYCMAGINNEIIKSAQKGVKLALNQELINYERYKNIILNREHPPSNSTHVGFLSSYQNDGFWTVQNEKRSFTGLYFKRLVGKNGYWTQPLDWEKPFAC